MARRGQDGTICKTNLHMGVTRNSCQQGQTLHTFLGVSRIQTGFLVLFLPYTQNFTSKTFKETNDNDVFSSLEL